LVWRVQRRSCSELGNLLSSLIGSHGIKKEGFDCQWCSGDKSPTDTSRDPVLCPGCFRARRGLHAECRACGTECRHRYAEPAERVVEPLVLDERYFWQHDFATASGGDSNISASQIALRQIAIPGSHDSTTYQMGKFTDVCQSSAFYQWWFASSMNKRVPVNPARLELKTIGAANKNYVLLADDDNGLYRYLSTRGLGDCVFHTNDFVTGGYAGLATVTLDDGTTANTNLWRALIAAYDKENSSYTADARRATEKRLIDGMSGARVDKLHETTDVWAYDQSDGVTDGDLFTLKQRYDDGLIQMSEKEVIHCSAGHLTNGPVEVGLLLHGADFIRRLDEKARALHTNVNIVNMDAIGSTPLSRNGFIGPLMTLNTRMVY
jgi:hypothetical protein